MIEQIVQIGLFKLGIVAVIGLLAGICEAARRGVDSGWTTVHEESLGKRALNRIRGRSSTSVEVRKD